jgi:rare lipoprotein A
LIAGCFALLSQVSKHTSLALDIPKVPKVPQPVSPVPHLNTAANLLIAQAAANRGGRKTLKNRLQSMAGLASWYGDVLNGHRTASGEIFDKDQLTACHRTLPFGTRVRVTAVNTGRSVIVRINDRGALFDDRVIDLSSAAARELGILRSGVAKVRLEVLKGKQQELRFSDVQLAY